MNVKRVAYGKADTPKELREYQIGGVGPVGTIAEIKKAYPGEPINIVSGLDTQAEAIAKNNKQVRAQEKKVKECVCGKMRKDGKDVACFICGRGV